MILDNLLTHEQKVYIAVLCGALWIYFRTAECYSMIPRHHLLPAVFVSLWIYFNYLDPLFYRSGYLY